MNTSDNNNRLAATSQAAGGVSYDGSGDVLADGVNQYLYDAASQLTGIVYQGGALAPANLAYSYDLDGRRVGVSGSLATTQLPAAVSSAVYNANNQLTQWGSTAMTYDLNGNTLNDGTNTYTWDARNRLVSADSNAASFAYDPFGRRVGKTLLAGTTNFLYDGANPVQELSGSTVTANLLTGGLDERFLRTTATETDNYLTDDLGSTVALTGTTGSSEAEYSYGPFGSMSITGSTTNSYNYTGRETDGLGINYYRARYYNPGTGRFLSEDPIGFRGGINKYAYVSDRPTNLVDPSGKSEGPIHMWETYDAARDSGWPVTDSAQLAWDVAMVDFQPGSQGTNSDAANRHAMGGRKDNGNQQTPCEAYDGTENAVQMAPTQADALHAIQDSFVHNYANWDGGSTPLHIPSLSHIYNDLFYNDDAESASAAYLQSTNVSNWGAFIKQKPFSCF